MLRVGSVIKLMIILLASGIVGLLLLVLANLLPSDRIKSHIADGVFVILQESAEFEYAEGYVSAILDDYTDTVILSKTAWPSEHPLADAVNAPSYSWPGQSAEDMEIFGYINGNSLEEAQIDTYPRYWHGYQVVLRPLFTLFGYADLRILNQMAQMSLLITVLYSMFRCGLSRYLVPFAAMILMWNPATTGVSLQYSPCYYISMITSLIILVATYRYGKGKTVQPDSSSHTERQRFLECLLFMMSGIVTSYLDFLTYPLATLGVPLVFLFLTGGMDDADCNDLENRVISSVITVVRLSLCWSVGYIGMWAEKWIYGSLVTGTNIMADALGAVATRTASDNGTIEISRVGTILYLIKRAFASWGAVVLIVVAVAIATIMSWRSNRNHDVNEIETTQEAAYSNARIFALILIGLMPFVWYFLTANHSYIHPRLVYRSMGITIFAWLSAWMMIVREWMQHYRMSARQDRA